MTQEKKLDYFGNGIVRRGNPIKRPGKKHSDSVPIVKKRLQRK